MCMFLKDFYVFMWIWYMCAYMSFYAVSAVPWGGKRAWCGIGNREHEELNPGPL